MSLYPIFSIITVFLALAFVLLHLLASLSEVKKGNHTLGNHFSSSEVALRLCLSSSTSFSRLSHYPFG